MEPINLEMNNKMNISPSLSDQTNRTSVIGVVSEITGPGSISNGFHLDDRKQTTNGDHHSELISDLVSTTSVSGSLSMQQPPPPTTPSKHYNMNSNKENLQNCYIEEKMDATMDEPMEVDTTMSQTPLNTQRTVSRRPDEQPAFNDDEPKPTTTAKPPIHGAKIVKPIRPVGPRVVKPYVPPVAGDFNEDKFANIDPFKSKPKVGIETTPTNNPADAPSSSYRDLNNEDDGLSTPTRQSAPASTTATTPTSNISTTPPATAAEQDNQQDEWESHKKRSSSSGRKSFSKMIQDESTTKTSQQDTSPPTKQTSSIVSSSTDLSSSVSSSPPPTDHAGQPINPLLALSATSTSSFSSSNTNSTSSIGGTVGLSKLNDDINFQTPKHQTYSNNLNNLNDELLKDDVSASQELSQEKLAQLKQCQFIESSSRGEMFNDIDNLIDFNKLHDTSASADEKINETNDFKTDENLQSHVDMVVFDSIFSNDNDFQSFLDLLEKKEVSSIKNSPKYSEFARKSLYLQFDPITAQLNKQLSPDKVKRLSLIVDKQEAIKTFLSGITEEENEEENVIESATATAAAANTATNNESSTLQAVTPPNRLLDLEHHISEESTSTTTATVNDNLKNDRMKLNAHTMNDQNTNSVESKFELDPRFSGGMLQENEFNDTAREDLTSNSHNTSPMQKQNNTILDLDQMEPISETKLCQHLANTSINIKPIDNSLLDDIQIFAKNTASLKSQTSTRSLSKANSLDEPHSSHLTNGVTNGHTNIVNGDDSSSAIIAKLMNENKELKEKEKASQAQIQSLEDENEKFKTVAIEFEEIFRNLIKDKDESEQKLKNEIIELTKERGHLQEDVIGVERAFDDLHRRFEKLKTKVEEFKKNEESLQKAIETYKQQLDKEKNKYSTLKKHAEEKLEQANSEIDKLRKSTSIELQTLKAELRKAEIKISSLELSVQQKDQENTQLTNLLEDLLSKVKPNS